MNNNNFIWGIGLMTASLSAGYVAVCESCCPRKNVDYTKLYDAISDILEDENYDDGSYGPVFVRLAWHASGTFCSASNTGGSCGGTIRFDKEISTGANAGLKHARDRLEIIKKQFPHISYGDLYTFAGVVAIQEMGGPSIAWRPGRIDAATDASCPPDGRLPAAAPHDGDSIRKTFGKGRMDFTPQEMVALIGGGHSIGRCHKDRSGYEGPWTFSPTTFSNAFFPLLLNEKWEKRQWNGPEQYTNTSGNGQNTLMMLPADTAFKTDPEFRKYAEIYANDSDKLNQDFAKAFAKLLELGVNYKPDCEPQFYKSSQ